MADKQRKSQPSQLQLDEEDLNKLQEAVSKNNACSSSMQSGEDNVCLSSTSENLVRQLYQTANSQIVQLTSTLLNDLFFAGCTEVCIISLSNILNIFLLYSVCFVNIYNKIKRLVGLVNSPLTLLLIPSVFDRISALSQTSAPNSIKRLS